MWIILDLIIVAIVLFYVLLSAKKGFVRTLIEVVGFIAAIVVALTFSTPASNFIYDKAIHPTISNSVESAMQEGVSSTTDAVNAVWEKMPSFLSENKFLNLPKIDSTEDTTSIIDTNELSENISQRYIKPLITKVLSIAISVILVVVLLFVVKILAKYVNKIFNFSVVGDINKTLGGILGVVKGGAVAIIFCLIISLILSFSKNGFLIFTYENIQSTFIFKFLMEFSPFL